MLGFGSALLEMAIYTLLNKNDEKRSAPPLQWMHMCYLCTCCYLFKCIPTNAVRCCFFICRSSVRGTSMRTPCCLYNAINECE